MNWKISCLCICIILIIFSAWNINIFKRLRKDEKHKKEIQGSFYLSIFLLIFSGIFLVIILKNIKQK